jgi:NAD(P)-dependent dehydrogenase (short-subunit alcohol dehydrogenase family)
MLISLSLVGGARGLGLSFARGCAEVGGNVAVIDKLAAPDPEFALLETECGVRARFYKYEEAIFSLRLCFMFNTMTDWKQWRCDGLRSHRITA